MYEYTIKHKNLIILALEQARTGLSVFLNCVRVFAREYYIQHRAGVGNSFGFAGHICDFKFVFVIK